MITKKHDLCTRNGRKWVIVSPSPKRLLHGIGFTTSYWDWGRLQHTEVKKKKEDKMALNPKTVDSLFNTLIKKKNNIKGKMT